MDFYGQKVNLVTCYSQTPVVDGRKVHLL